MDLSTVSIAVVEDDGEYLSGLFHRLHVRAFTSCCTLDEAYQELVLDKLIDQVDVLVIDLMLDKPKKFSLETTSIEAGLSFHKWLETTLRRPVSVVFHSGATDSNEELERRVKTYVADSPSTRVFSAKNDELDELKNKLLSVYSRG